MLEDLRNSANFNDEPETPPQPPKPAPERRAAPRPAARFKDPLILGMTAVQRLIVALLLLFSTCLLGALCLVITGRVYLP